MKTHVAKAAVSAIVLAVATLGAASSFAASEPAAVQGGKTRAEVVAEYQRALKAGEIVRGESDNAVPALVQASGKTRAEVMAEYQRALKAGELVHGVDGYAWAAPSVQSIRSRDEVRKEAVERVIARNQSGYTAY
jgi:predicted RNase H-like HicB family nuclease